MANLTALSKAIAVNIAFQNGAGPSSLNVNLNEIATGNNMLNETQTATTGGWTAVGLGNLASVDVIVIRNLDQTNYVQVALDNAGAHIVAKLLPAPSAPVFIPLDSSATLYVKANTASCMIQVLAAEP